MKPLLNNENNNGTVRAKKSAGKIVSQIKFSKDFLEKLLGKLTVGNGRSIHLNAIPGRSHTRLDLHDLLFDKDAKTGRTSDAFFQELVSRPKFSFKISVPLDERTRMNLSDEDKSRLQTVCKKLDNIVSDNEDMYLETGLKNFGFGYPLLVKADKNDAKKTIVAPLFIWSLDINKSNRRNEWTVTKTEDSFIKVNELLISHIKTEDNITLPKLTDEDLENNVLTSETMRNYVKQLYQQLGIKDDVPDVMPLEKCPETKDKIKKIPAGSAYVQFSGVFGLYRSQKEPIIEATRELLENIDEYNAQQLIIEPFQTNITTSFEVDPSQREIIDTLNDDEFKIIQGPPGTGKSQAISAIISNALANGARTLVVCEKKTALDVLVKNLSDKGLQDFCAVIDDVVKDRRAIVEKARRIYEENGQSYGLYGFDENAFANDYKQFTELRDSVNASYQQSSKPFFAEKNWKDLVGEYLLYSNKTGFKKTKADFGKLELDFTPEGLSNYLSIIDRGGLLYAAVKDIKKTCFNYIDFDAFGENMTISQKNTIENNVQNAISITTDLLTELKKSEYEYDGLTIVSSPGDINDKISKIQEIEEKFSDAKKIYKSDLSMGDVSQFITSVMAFNKFARRFGDKVDIDTTLQAQAQILDNIQKAALSINEHYDQGQDLLENDFDIGKFGLFNRLFSSVHARAYGHIKNIKRNLGVIRQNLARLDKYDSCEKRPAKWREYSNLESVLNDVTVLEKELKPQCTKIHKGIAAIFKQMTELNKSFSDRRLLCRSILDCKKHIDSTGQELVTLFPSIKNRIEKFDDIKGCRTVFSNLLKNLNELNLNLDKIEEYNSWLKFERSNQGLMSILQTVDIDSWRDTFLASYYYQLLLNFESKSAVAFHKRDTDLKLLRKLYEGLEQKNLQRTLNLWAPRIQEATSWLDHAFGFKALFALKRNQRYGNRLSLRQIIDADFDAFTTIFPVILVNPIVANTLFKLEQGTFDLVIFDEASQLRIEDVYTSMIKGKYKIIAGDKHQMPPSNYFQSGLDGVGDDGLDVDVRSNAQLNAESLLVFAESLEHKNMSYLDFHYRSKHPALINFSNAAFYGGNLCPLPVIGQDYTPIEIREVKGVYKSGRGNNINPDEAQEVIAILKSIKQNPDGSMPSVGIATFNIHQRNLIKERLYEASYTDSAFGVKFDQLQSAGLFVKNLENIQGDEKDIIIISTTFGPDETGRFYQRFGSILTENGYKLLNVLVTRAKHKLYLVTSIPESAYSKYNELLESSKENNKIPIFYAYIAYAKAVSNGDHDTVASILKLLCEHSHDRQRLGAMTVINATASPVPTGSIFEDQVYTELSKILDKKQITRRYTIGGYQLDFMLDVNGHRVALECDGKTYHNTDQAYATDMHRQKWIGEKFGFDFYRIWSTNWFENKDRELTKLKQFLDSLKNKKSK